MRGGPRVAQKDQNCAVIENCFVGNSLGGEIAAVRSLMVKLTKGNILFLKSIRAIILIVQARQFKCQE